MYESLRSSWMVGVKNVETQGLSINNSDMKERRQRPVALSRPGTVMHTVMYVFEFSNTIFHFILFI